MEVRSRESMWISGGAPQSRQFGKRHYLHDIKEAAKHKCAKYEVTVKAHFAFLLCPTFPTFLRGKKRFALLKYSFALHVWFRFRTG